MMSRFKMRIFLQSCLAHLVGLLVLTAMATVFLHCAPRMPIRQKSFSKPNVDNIKLGMTTSEIESIFGAPDQIYECVYGEDTDNPWDALVYKYFTGTNKQFRYMKALRSNIFVFYNGTNPPRLNYWRVDAVVE